MNASSYECVDYGAPESFFVFVVGNCEEWPEDREEQGDIALYNEYLASGVPPDQVLFLQDKRANYANCNKQFSNFLQRTRPHSTLVFSYGGHGKPTGFCTHKRVWPYREVLHMIEKLFQGERVLFLLDCCASGNIASWLCLLHPVPTKQYVVLASSPPFVTTTDEGEEWILNHRWMLGMRCNDGNLPLHRVIECLSDRTALILGDQFTVFMSDGVDDTKGHWMPRRQPHEISTSYQWDRLEHRIPKDARVTARYSIGDQVFYKHMGGPVDAGSQYIPPGWFAATILSEVDDQSVQLEVCHPVRNLKWNAHAPRQQLINNFYMAQMWMLPDEFEEAQCTLARNMKYLDCSIEATTPLNVVAKDGEIHSARVLDWRIFDWETYVDEEQCDNKPPFGPQVPVQWLHKDETELIPVESIASPTMTIRPFLDSFESIQGNEEEWARKALLCSIESSGKTICNASEVLNGNKLKAFWPEEGEWYNVAPMDPNLVPIEVLATHAQFAITGAYCPLAYEDGEFHLSPLFYIKKR